MIEGDNVNYYISKASTSGKDYSVNEKEEQFFAALNNALPQTINEHIHLQRLSNGTLAVYFGSFPVGKIKLQGRKYWMQILKGMYTVKVIDGDVEDFISHIPDWERYIRLHCK